MGTTDPAWLLAARALIGTREAAGGANNARQAAQMEREISALRANRKKGE